MGFREYVFRRAVDSIVTLFFALILNFFLFYTQMRAHQNTPTWEQFIPYLEFVFLKGFGPYSGGYPTTLGYIIFKLPPTLLLLSLSVLFAILAGIVLGVVASYKRGKKVDLLLTMLLVIPLAVPSWWLGHCIFATLPANFPIHGWYSDRWIWVSPWSDPLVFAKDVMWHLTVPVLTLTLSLAGIYFLVTRDNLIHVFVEDYIKTAKVKGLSPRVVMFKHALRNALLPITAIIALTPPLIVLGVIIIDKWFNLGGLGSTLYRSVVSLAGEVNPPGSVLQAIFLIFSVLMIVSHFILDVIRGYLDPRLRTDGGLPRLVGHRNRPSISRQKLKMYWDKFKRGKSGLFGLAVLSIFVFLAVFAPIFPLPDPSKGIIYQCNPPSLEHWLGTDQYGRDVLSRLIVGTRFSLLEAFGSIVVALGIGCLVGMLSGYYSGRWFSYPLDRVTDLFLSIPLIAFVIYFPMEEGPLKWVVAVGSAAWAITAKLVRSQVLSTKEKPYIEAAKASGAGDRYILLHYVLPEALTAVASSAIFVAVTAMTIQSSLDVFGFKRKTLDPMDVRQVAPYITWGTMLSYNSLYIFVQRGWTVWWTVLPPAVCMALLVLSLVAISNKVAEALNPKLE